LYDFGTYDKIITDPQSDIVGKAVAELNAWLGLEYTVSLVDRHESNSVDGTNKRITGKSEHWYMTSVSHTSEGSLKCAKLLNNMQINVTIQSQAYNHCKLILVLKLRP
jgi:hypothetical protein